MQNYFFYTSSSHNLARPDAAREAPKVRITSTIIETNIICNFLQKNENFKIVKTARLIWPAQKRPLRHQNGRLHYDYWFIYLLQKKTKTCKKPAFFVLAAKSMSSRRGQKSRYQHDFLICFWLFWRKSSVLRCGHLRRLATPPTPRAWRIVRG